MQERYDRVPETSHKNMQGDAIFCVTDVDAANDAVGIQHFGGDMGEAPGLAA